MNPNTHFFTSDLHLFHRGILRHQANRSFDSVEAMNEALVTAWNRKVPATGTVFVLGDLSFAGWQDTSEILCRLNGFIKLVPGNHDDPRVLRNLENLNLIEVLPQYHELKIDGKVVILCHYPFDTWNKSHYGTAHLHGHCHGHLPAGDRRRLDVGVDGRPSQDFEPWSWVEIKALLNPLS